MRACSTDDICTHATRMSYTSIMEMKQFLVPLFYCPWFHTIRKISMVGCRITFGLWPHVIRHPTIDIFPYCMNKQGITNNITGFKSKNILKCTFKAKTRKAQSAHDAFGMRVYQSNSRKSILKWVIRSHITCLITVMRKSIHSSYYLVVLQHKCRKGVTEKLLI